MRPVILRLLLLAVFFNTAIGSSLHAAEHLRESVAARAVADAAFRADRVEASDEAPEPAAHGACAWCAAFVHGEWLDAPASALLVPGEAHALRLAKPTPAAPAPLRWRFAARDPPH